MPRRHWLASGLFSLMLLVSGQALALKFGFVITEVVDGHAMVAGARESYRPKSITFSAIDAPRLAQPYGKEAQQKLESLVLNKWVTASCSGFDKKHDYCDIQVDGQDVVIAMLESGMAMIHAKYKDDPKFAKRNPDIVRAEKVARDNKVGLWAQENFVPPWVWDAQKATMKPKRPVVASSATTSSASASSASATTKPAQKIQRRESAGTKPAQKAADKPLPPGKPCRSGYFMQDFFGTCDSAKENPAKASVKSKEDSPKKAAPESPAEPPSGATSPDAGEGEKSLSEKAGSAIGKKIGEEAVDAMLKGMAKRAVGL